MFDTVRHYETPEGTELSLRTASVHVRFVACLLDLLIRMAIYFALAMVLGLMGAFGQGLIMIVGFIGEWFYPVLFEVYRHGQTPGKSAMRIKVVHDDGTPISWGASTLRNILRFADMQPVFTYGVGLMSTIVHSDSKRIGDIAAGTLVVYTDEKRHKYRPIEAEEWSPAIQLTLPEQQAIREFAARTESWHPERTAEIADHLEVLTQASGKDGVQKVLGMARWLEGKR